MMLKYKVISEEFHDSELGDYIGYGIAAECDGERLLTVSDMSCDRGLVADLAERCNELELDPMHLYDVIEDVLS